MFTGIIEELGRVREAGERLVVGCRKVLMDSAEGSSVAVNGVCLTVVERAGANRSGTEGGSLAFDVSKETLSRTALGRAAAGDPVNLERPVTLLARLGGHLVQGHVDGVGEVSDVRESGSGKELWITMPPNLIRYIVEKGCIAVDGVSLTVAGLREGAFGVALVPYTLDATTLGALERRDPVNLEVDVIAKYVEGLLGPLAVERERSR
jgi:riboflavin synthase